MEWSLVNNGKDAVILHQKVYNLIYTVVVVAGQVVHYRQIL